MKQNKFIRVEDVIIPDSFYQRYKTGIETLDFFFGEGILPGSSMTLTAKAGTGKTQFCLQLLEALSKNGYAVAYASNEESIEQIAFTAKRLKVKDVPVGNIDYYTELITLMNSVDIIVIDSFSVMQANQNGEKISEKEITNKLVKAAKESNCVIIFIMHLTKDGKMKGSTYVPHKVDANICIESEEDGDPTIRRIFFNKNRFGPPADITVKMTSNGFNFTQVLSEGTAEKSSKKRKNKLSEATAKIMTMTEPPTLTIERVMKELNCNSLQASYYLRDLTLQDKLVKIGRGAEAVYKFKKITVDSEKEYSIIIE
jgi:predicted ATP-dependent serine protease